MEDSKSEEIVDIIRLNVGGCIYTARRESLCRFKESMLASMFSGRFPLKRDDSGACFIDRDGRLFKYLLDYLHGEVRLPEDEQTRIALHEEADYFGIPYPCSLADHLANEMETYCGRSNLELKKALIGFCDTYGLICTKPTVWVLHYLSTSGASCESKVIGVYATRSDGTTAIEKKLGGRIHSKNIYKREAGNNVQYIWSYYSVNELKKMMDAFETWEGKGVSYWRAPQELIECWTLEECPLKGSLENITTVHKRQLMELSEESPLNSRTGRKPIQFSGPSTSTQIKVKNSASLKIAACPLPLSSQKILKRPRRGSLLLHEEVPKPAETTELPKIQQETARSTENGAACKRTLKVPLSKKPAASRIVKLKRIPLCNEFLTQQASTGLSMSNEQQVPAVAVSSVSAAQVVFGVSVENVTVENHVQIDQLKNKM